MRRVSPWFARYDLANYMTISASLNNASALSVSLLRAGRGLFVRYPAKRQPQLPLELFEFESCPFCKKVRETFSELDLDYISRSTYG